MTFELSSSAFVHGSPIPSVFTCDAEDVSPPLAWGEPPPGTRSLALLVDDPDAPDPDAPTTVWVHWVLYDLPPDTRELAQAADDSTLPPGARQGLNDWNRAEYGGPCPPIGRHRYFFKLYALDTESVGLEEPTGPALEHHIENNILATATLMGTYERRK